jgi:hypothetical protein
MKRVLARIAIVVLVGAPAPVLAFDGVRALDPIAPQQRQDVREVTLPPPPSGPATPSPFCSPSSPTC